jgi:LytTr DNA-binding domain
VLDQRLCHSIGVGADHCKRTFVYWRNRLAGMVDANLRYVNQSVGMLRLSAAQITTARLQPAQGNDCMSMPAFLDYWANLSWREFAKHVGLYAVIACVLATLGPFNTYNDPFIWRYSYWMVMFGIFGGLIMPVMARVVQRTGTLNRMTIFIGASTLMVLGAVPMTIFVLAMDWLAYKWIMSTNWVPFAAVAQMRAEAGPPESGSWGGIVTLYANVLAVALISFGAISLFVINRHHRLAGPTGRQTRAGVDFFSRLPDHLGTDLIYLQMEDHYLRAVTTQGEALVLVRFRDAMREVADVTGMQVHRSWWVASTHVVKFHRSGRRAELVMSNQARVPVSASFKSAVETVFPAFGGRRRRSKLQSAV